jgi:hypothetical protein
VLLAEAHAEQVVRNRKNSSYYRFDSLAEHRVRIRPLELFPNGLLIEKTADTIVEPDLEVDAIGDWSDEFFVDDPRGPKLFAAYKQELGEKREELQRLEAEYETIDPNAHGGRGSHANKIKAVVGRVAALERGLADRKVAATTVKQSVKATVKTFADRTLVQLPSGLPAVVLGTVQIPSDKRPHARLRVKSSDGQLVPATVVQECLRPYEHRFMATV